MDRLLAFNDRPLRQGAGGVRHEDMKAIASGRYEQFDARHRRAEAVAADDEDLQQLEEAEKELLARHQPTGG